MAGLRGCTGIAVVQGVGIAGDLDAEGFAGSKDPRGGFEIEVPLVWSIGGVVVGEEVGAAGGADTDEIGVAVGSETDEFDDEVGEWCRGGRVKGDLRSAKDAEGRDARCRCVGEEVVAEFKSGLVVAAAGGGDASWGKDGNFGIDYEDVRGFGDLWRDWSESSIATARVCATFAAEVEGVVGGGPLVGSVPLVFVHGEVADPRFGGEFAGIFEPVIKPA